MTLTKLIATWLLLIACAAPLKTGLAFLSALLFTNPLPAQPTITFLLICAITIISTAATVSATITFTSHTGIVLRLAIIANAILAQIVFLTITLALIHLAQPDTLNAIAAANDIKHQTLIFIDQLAP